MRLRQSAPPFVVSTVVHTAILIGLYFIVISTPAAQIEPDLETVMLDEERAVDEVMEELDEQTEPATSMNFVSGSVSQAVGGSEAPLSKTQKIEVKETLQDPEVKVPIAAQNLPGAEVLTQDLGQAEVTGEVGDVVEGYGAALDRLTRELIRMLRTDKLLVVWMFDESESMKDDQEEIRSRLKRVYEELHLIETDEAAAGPGGTKKLQDVLLTAITSFGEVPHKQTPRPTGNPEELMKAIGKIPIDKTGTENLCTAIVKVVTEYKLMAARGDRKLVLVIVSDESGDDGHLVEDALREARGANAPIYILGREAVFGSLFAHVKWRQPQTGRIFYLPIRRGPETPFAEQLQYNGFRRRRDSHISGFGPYEQVRLCWKTNGIFFQLPGEQENLNDLDDRENTALNLREYLPDLSSRSVYQNHRDGSDFRKAIWDVIVMLNPYHREAKGILELPDPEQTRERFNTNPASYGPKVQKRLQKIQVILKVMQKARRHLSKVQRLRASEPSTRWRANYDLISAQLLWYQVRLFQYAIGLEQFARKGVPARLKEHPKHNRWYIRENPSQFMLPDEVQQKLLGVTPDELKTVHDQAVAGLEKVQELHPGTPWARRAEWELNRKSGIQFRTYQHKPSPSKPNVKRPKPPPPPKL